MIIKSAEELKLVKENGLAKLLPKQPRIGVGMGTCGIGNGAEEFPFFTCLMGYGEGKRLDSCGETASRFKNLVFLIFQ